MKLLLEEDDYKSIIRRLDAQEREINFLKSMLANRQWLSRRQTLDMLCVSETTLHYLTKAEKVVYRHEGRKILYELNSVRAYLDSKKIEPAVVDRRVLQALTAGQETILSKAKRRTVSLTN